MDLGVLKWEAPAYLRGAAMQTFNGARVTVYGYGRDNAYKGHPDGGDSVRTTHDTRRVYGGAAHAILGSCAFQHPTTMAVQPESNIPDGSMVYVYGMGWFIVEDHCQKGLLGPRFDMWSGPTTEQERSALDKPEYRNVAVYTHLSNVPPNLRELVPSHAWTAHFNKMRERIRSQNLNLFVAP
jgi:3D (Asp-Asp-Asp) domain-containing protein